MVNLSMTVESFPDPNFVDWGDMVSVTVTNKMPMNGSGLHFHGIRQLNSNLQDGVGGITECKSSRFERANSGLMSSFRPNTTRR